jgi:hypothetical protein
MDMSTKKKSLKVRIKGLEWTIFGQSNASYVREHGKDSGAITYPQDREIYFNTNHFTPGYVRHELLHAFVSSCGTNSSSLTADQVEELCAEIVEEHYYEIGDIANTIVNFLLKK